jgi:hypothetical protein
MQADARETRVLWHVADHPLHQVAVFEERRGETHLLGVARGVFVDADRFAEQIARMEKHRAERQIVLVPQRLIAPEPDVAVLVVAQRLHPTGQSLAVRHTVGLGGQFLGVSFDRREIDVLANPSLRAGDTAGRDNP